MGFKSAQVLIDPEMRAVYDETGERGINSREGKRRGAAQEVWESWAEFKPFKRKLVLAHFLQCIFAQQFFSEACPVLS